MEKLYSEGKLQKWRECFITKKRKLELTILFAKWFKYWAQQILATKEVKNLRLNSFITRAPIIEKPFAQQISGLDSI